MFFVSMSLLTLIYMSAVWFCMSPRLQLFTTDQFCLHTFIPFLILSFFLCFLPCPFLFSSLAFWVGELSGLCRPSAYSRGAVLDSPFGSLSIWHLYVASQVPLVCKHLPSTLPGLTIPALPRSFMSFASIAQALQCFQEIFIL